MRLAFFHDHKLIKSKNNDFYSTGGLPYSIWKRYFPIFNHITLTTRVNSIVDNELNTNKFSIASGIDLEISPILEYNSIIDILTKYFLIRKKIRFIVLQADVVIVRLPSMLGLLAYSEAKKARKPVGVEVVSCAFDTYWYHTNITGKLLAPIIFLMNKNVIKKSDAVAYITSSFLQKRYPTLRMGFKGVANVSIDPVPESVLIEKLKYYESFNYNCEIIIGMIGNLEIKYKNHINALKIVSQLLKKGYNKIKLEFVGAGNKDKLQKKCMRMKLNNNVEFLGTLKSGMEVNKWMDKLTFYLQPSITEGHGRSVIEAMSRGCVVITSNSGGLSETVDVGFRTYYKKIEKFVDIIVNSITSSDILKANAIRNYNFSKNFYFKEIEYRRSLFLNYLASLAQKNG